MSDTPKRVILLDPTQLDDEEVVERLIEFFDAEAPLPDGDEADAADADEADAD